MLVFSSVMIHRAANYPKTSAPRTAPLWPPHVLALPMSSNWTALAIVVVCTLYAVAVLVWFPKWTVDDAYITYRYAENLALHGQLTWNPGADPVEGYTGVALPVALAAAIAAGADPDVASKTLGVLAFVLLAAAMWRLCGRLGVPLPGKAAALAGLCSAPFMFTHALSGLETVPFMAGVALAIDRAAAIEAASRFARSLWLGFAASALVVSLIRPEGVALSLVLLAACLLSEARRRSCVEAPDPYGLVRRTLALSATCRAAGIWLAVYALPGAAYFAWRVWYYGQLLPNTFYAKLHTGFVAESFVDLAKFSVLYLAVPVAAAVVAIAIARRRTIPALAVLPWRTAAATALFVALCVALYLRSALVMNFGFRFFVPFYPVFLVAMAAVASRAIAVAPNGRVRSIGLAAIALLLVAQFGINTSRLGQSAREADATERLLTEEHRRVGQFLRDRLPSDASVVVVVDAGAIPYVSGLRTIDFGGLNDEFLSHRFRDRTPKNEIADYFFASNPAAVVFTSRSADRIDGPEPVPVQEDPRFANYVLARVFSCESWPEYHQLVYLRRDVGLDSPLRLCASARPLRRCE